MTSFHASQVSDSQPPSTTERVRPFSFGSETDILRMKQRSGTSKAQQKRYTWQGYIPEDVIPNFISGHEIAAKILGRASMVNRRLRDMISMEVMERVQGIGISMREGENPLSLLFAMHVVEATGGQRRTKVSTGGGHNRTPFAARIGHTALVANKGKLMTWGSNDGGQLGHGNLENMSTPTVVPSLAQKHIIMMVATGYGHTAAVTDWGVLFSWGWGEKGQLGHGALTNHSTPKQVEGFNGQRVVTVSAGQGHTAAVSDVGDLWTWGKNSNGQLGHGGFRQELSPKQVEITAKGRPVRVICTSCGENFTLALTSENDANVRSFGNNDKGQLGIGSTKETLKPTRIEAFRKKRLLMVDAGESHGIGLTDNKQVLTWGADHTGQLGHGDLESQLVRQS